jgi:hypothetical protein
MHRIPLCAVIVMVTAGMLPAQNLLLNPSFDDPPIGSQATITISGNVADGETVTIDSAGANPRVYEFDTGNGVTGANIAVNVSAGLGKANAKTALIAAINGDASCPCTATAAGGDDITLNWKGGDGYGVANAETGANITITSFTKSRATITISGNVNDGETVTIDVGGANRVYEFDTAADPGNLVDPAHVRVNVSGGASKAAAKAALVTAINDDPSCPCTATALADDRTFLAWKTGEGEGATNTEDGANITISDFTNDCTVNNDHQPVSYWKGADGNPYAWRNGDQHVERCPRDPLGENDSVNLSAQGAGIGESYVYQTVENLTPSALYMLNGWYFGYQGADFGWVLIRMELHGGADPTQNLIAFYEYKQMSGATLAWIPFTVCAPAPESGQITVVLKWQSTVANIWAAHFDGCSLVQVPSCSAPSLSSITPAYAANDDTDVSLTIQGENLKGAGGDTVVKLYKKGLGGTDLWHWAWPVEVAPDGKSLTCSFAFWGAEYGAEVGRYHVLVTVPIDQSNSVTAALPGAFNLVNPAFTNGGFELPTATAACPVPAGGIQGFPTGWLPYEVAGYGWGTVLFRDSDRFAPTCPSPAGHYASSISDTGGGASPTARAAQTFLVTANQQYTLTGYFAGGGSNTVTIKMRDGDDLATAIPGAAETVHAPGGQYDWTFAAVTGKPTTDLLTVEWDIALNGNGPHAAHADGLEVAICNNPITVTGVTPPQGVNNEQLDITNLAGTGFSASGNPKVLLSKVGGGTTLNASPVNVISSTQISCTVSKEKLAGAASGYYDIIVVQSGCVAKLPNALLLLADGLMNGEFEEPTATFACGTLTSAASGWNFTDDKWRDHVLHQPATCPRVTGSNHYQSMTTGTDRSLRDQRAWQSLSVQPGNVYRFSGYFAGGGQNEVWLRLLDGGPNGTEIASTQVHACTASCGDYNWISGGVSGVARSSALTVVWEMIEATSDGSTTHADGMKLESICNTPFADFDGDDDVDQADFAFMQRCYTGGSQGYPAGCDCADKVAPFGIISLEDLNRFEACASGAGVMADPDCN